MARAPRPLQQRSRPRIGNDAFSARSVAKGWNVMLEMLETPWNMQWNMLEYDMDSTKG
jgi:hypothetical protein